MGRRRACLPMPVGLPHHPQISRGHTLGLSAIPGCPGGSTGTSRPFASLRAKGAPLRGGSLLWTTWTIRRAVVKRSRQAEHQQIATGLEWQRHFSWLTGEVLQPDASRAARRRSAIKGCALPRRSPQETRNPWSRSSGPEIPTSLCGLPRGFEGHTEQRRIHAALLAIADATPLHLPFRHDTPLRAAENNR